jgi:hypothetical protein
MDNKKRNLQILKMAQDGISYQEIGKKIGLSKQGVGHILKRNFPDFKCVDKNNRISKGMLDSKIFEEKRKVYTRRYINEYIQIRIGNSREWILEHRYIMEQHLGRKLDKSELVHHRNCIKDDNRLENLELILIGMAHKGIVRCPHCLNEFSIK